MRHRLFALFLAFALALSLGVSAADAVDAAPSTSPILVDGKQVSCGAYAITGANGYANNYFKLRDVAKLLSGTKAQFNVTWDGAANAIRLETGKPYAEVGGELAAVPAGKVTARPNASAVYLDGRRITLEGYTIAQNNYFKLRDLGNVLGFSVSWDSKRGAVQVESKPFEMNVCIASEPQSIDPALNSAVDGAIMIQHAFEGLMKWEDSGVAYGDHANAAQLTYGQAESYDRVKNADGTTTYTFHLRDGIKWSDGQPVTAGDFVYAWQRLVTPETAADYNYMVDCVVNANEIMNREKDPSELAVSAPDDKTFVVTVYDVPYFTEICAFPTTYPVRRDIIEQYGDWWTFDVNTYIGNGPYKMTAWNHNFEIVMEPSETYYETVAGPHKLTFMLMDDNNAMLSAFNSGRLDFVEDMPIDEIPALSANKQLNIEDYIGTYYATFNTQRAPFDNALVRKAFTLAVDRKYIVEQVTRTGQVEAGGFVPAGIYDAAGSTGDDFRTVGGDYYDPYGDAYEANCEEARRLLAEAGYPGGEGFPIVTYLYNTSDAHRAVAQALKEMWERELGVKVILKNQEWAVFLQSRKNGDYYIARNSWIADYNDPTSFLDMWLTGGGNNDAQYENPAYDALIAQAKKTEDPAARMKLMHQAEDMIIGKDYALCPLYFYTQKYMLSDRIGGMYYTPLGYFFFGSCQLK